MCGSRISVLAAVIKNNGVARNGATPLFFVTINERSVCRSQVTQWITVHTIPLHLKKERLNLTSIKLMLTGAQAWASVSGPLTSGMVGIPVTIEYDKAWDGLTKNLMCRCSPWGSNDGEIRTILNVGEISVVAHEVMQPDMYLHLGVEGFSKDGNLVIPTTWASCGKIEYGANTCEDPSAKPELPIWNQLQTEVEQIKSDGFTQEQRDELQAYVQSASQSAFSAERSKEMAAASSNLASGYANMARDSSDQAKTYAENAATSTRSAANLANGALQAQRAAEAAAERAESAAGSGTNGYMLPIGGDELGGVKNGGNVIINADGTMTAPDNAPTDEQVGSAVSEYLDEHPELAANVADRSITAQKTTFITPEADNLIDMSRVVKGYQGTSGVPAGGSLPNTTTGCTTDYIQVEPGKTYKSGGAMGTGNWWATSWYYDSDKNPVTFIESDPFTVPDGVAYVRLTFNTNADISTLQLGLYRGSNPMVYTQGAQRYKLDELLTNAVKSVLDANSVFKVTEKNLYSLAGAGTMDSTTGAFTLSGGSLNISDYIEITTGVWYISNCFSAVGFSACYDANREYVGALDATTVEWGQNVVHDGGTYKVFKVTNPDVRYIVNGSAKILETPIATPFIVRGNTIPDSLDGIDISTPDIAFVEAAKTLLGITGNDLAGMTWAVLGDSITAASGLIRSYHSIIAEKLGLTAINYGYNGSRITYTDDNMAGTEMCTRYAEMTDDADIITCFGGINDINNSLPLGILGDTGNATFYGAMDILIRGLLSKYPGKRIGFVTPLNYGSDSAEPYVEAIFAVCRKYAVPVLDLYHEGMISTVTEELSATYFKDGLHPNELGHEVLARKVEAFLSEM